MRTRAHGGYCLAADALGAECAHTIIIAYAHTFYMEDFMGNTVLGVGCLAFFEYNERRAQ